MNDMKTEEIQWLCMNNMIDRGDPMIVYEQQKLWGAMTVHEHYEGIGCVMTVHEQYEESEDGGGAMIVCK